MTTTRLPLRLCPSCGTELSAATGVFDDEAKPEPDDPTVCMKCATVLRFTEDMSLVIYEDAGLRALPPEVRAQLTKAQEAVVALNRERRGK